MTEPEQPDVVPGVVGDLLVQHVLNVRHPDVSVAHVTVNRRGGSYNFFAHVGGGCIITVSAPSFDAAIEALAFKLREEAASADEVREHAEMIRDATRAVAAFAKSDPRIPPDVRLQIGIVCSAALRGLDYETHGADGVTGVPAT